MVRVFTFGSYKKPREIVWVLGVGLIAMVGGFAFTGYLLPWDQKAYWATVVGTNVRARCLLSAVRSFASCAAAQSWALFPFPFLRHPYLCPSLEPGAAGGPSRVPAGAGGSRGHLECG